MFIFNLFFSALVISLTSWLSKKFPELAGWIVALPLTTLLVLPLSHLQTGQMQNTTAFAKSIFTAIPVSLLFFVPFLFAEKFKLQFWQTYLAGIALLTVGYFLHKMVLQKWF